MAVAENAGIKKAVDNLGSFFILVLVSVLVGNSQFLSSLGSSSS